MAPGRVAAPAPGGVGTRPPGRLRRAGTSAVLGVLLGCGQAAVAGAATGAAPTPGREVCTITDQRLTELSGIVATPSGYIVVNDGTDQRWREGVFYLDRRCQVSNVVSFPGNGPRDPEDLALSPDRKTLWIGDIGDNDAQRETIALWRMPADGSRQPELFRFRYPDGAKDAEGLLIGRDGAPIVVTKGARAMLYRPVDAPRQGATVVLRKLGEVTLPKTTTSNPLGPLGRVAVTGAAASPDGRRVVLRTLADAFEWDVADGDVAAALTTGKPRVTPLPDEPLGEAISYTPDGAAFVTVSETAQAEDLQPRILRYARTKAPPPATAKAPLAGAGQGEEPSWFDRLTLDDITNLIAGVGLLGLALVVAGAVGIVRARRRPTGRASGTGAVDGQDRVGRGRTAAGAGRAAPGEPPDDAATAMLPPVREQGHGAPGYGAPGRGARNAGGRGFADPAYEAVEPPAPPPARSPGYAAGTRRRGQAAGGVYAAGGYGGPAGYPEDHRTVEPTARPEGTGLGPPEPSARY